MELIKYDEQTKIALFSYHSDSEIAQLPTMTKRAEGKLSSIGFVGEGSKALSDTEYKMYSLTADDEWVEYELNSGGGGSSEAVDINYDNTESGLSATNVQNAIDELTEEVTELSETVGGFDARISEAENTAEEAIEKSENAVLTTAQGLTDTQKAQARTNIGIPSNGYVNKGTVATVADLPSSGINIEDFYTVAANGHIYMRNPQNTQWVDVGTAFSTGNAVIYSPQTLSDTEKEQARTNIGAESIADANQIKQDLTQLDSDLTALTTVVGTKANQSNVDALTGRVSQLESNAISLDRRVTNLEYASRGVLYREETNTTAAYSKALDADVMPWGQLNTIGGKSVVWNQLFNKIDRTLSRGVIYTYDSTNRKVTVDDTDWDGVNSSSYSFNNDINLLVKGHKYIALSSETVPVGITYWDGSTYPFIPINSIFTADGSDGFSASLSFRITSSSYTQVGSPYSFDFYLVDLTQMYGAGNEPTTTGDPRIAEIEAYATLHPEYNTGEIVSAKVDKIISIGKNIAKFRPDLNTDAQNFNYTINQDNAIVATRIVTPGKFYAVFKAKVEKGKNYKFSAAPGANVQIYLYTDRIWGTTLEQFTMTSSGGMGHNYTATYTGDLIIGMYSPGSDASSEVSIYDFMLRLLDASVEYKHYMELEYQIPSEVQALDGYGESNGTKVNYIDYSAKKFIAYGHYVDGTWVDYSEPIETDISAYLGDNAINVEGGGKLAFHQNGTEFVVPNSENFLIKTGG